jgi:hypothetical protein
MPPTLGLSIQPASSGSLFLRLQATKSTRHLAFELHIPFVHVLDVATPIGRPGAPRLRGARNFTNSTEEK